MSTLFSIRLARPADMPAVVSLIRALARYERLPGPDEAAAARLAADAFTTPPRYELLVAEADDGTVFAYALFFMTYSTFLARPSLYLEDLFVSPDRRGQGVGRAFLQRLAALALERGCGRLDWSVLDWNTRAQDFYRSLGARVHQDWWLCRVEGEALVALAGPSPGSGDAAPR